MNIGEGVPLRGRRRTALAGAIAAAVAAGAVIWGTAGASSEPSSAVTPDWHGNAQEVAAALDETAWRSPAIYPAAPWTIDNAEIQPALQFPPGTTYSEAIGEIYAAAGQGALPTGAELVEPLAPGKVVRPATEEGGVTVSLMAPYGYDVQTGNIVTPIFEEITPRPVEAGPWSDEEMLAFSQLVRADDGTIPDGFRVAGSALIDCQVDHPTAPTTCDDEHVAPPLVSKEITSGVGPVLVSRNAGDR
ncbi:MAG TPA: hypothetical protein PKE32_08040 [Miltoncostaeaceae bacterium]|nr:hypothetical protein [Miltoncostaeaceae bacterium]